MSIYNINTIQEDVNTTYNDEYIKQALANLGQRNGLKGDSIYADSFYVSDILGSEAYNVNKYFRSQISGDIIKFYLDNNDKSFFEYKYNTEINKDEIHVVENIGTDEDSFQTFEECKIIKYTDSYYFSSICNDNIIVFDFNTVQNNIYNCIFITLSGLKTIGVYVLNNLSNKSYSFNVDHATATTLEDLYENSIKKCNSINDVLNTFTNNTVAYNESINDKYNTIIEGFEKNLLDYIRKIFNDSIYNEDNTFIGLKRKILADIIMKLYTDYGAINVYFSKDCYLPYIGNKDNKNIYESFDINIKCHNDNSIVYFKNYSIIAEANFVDDKYLAYKFSVTYVDNSYVNNIDIHQTYILPYIGLDSDGRNEVWYINDSETSIKANGLDGNNSNILMCSFTKDQDTNETNVNILHNYNNELINTQILTNIFTNPDELIEISFYYDLGKNVSINNTNNNNFEFTISLPDPNTVVTYKGFEELFKNVLLISIVDINLSKSNENLGGINLAQYLQNKTDDTHISYITVFWHIINENGTYYWKPILNPSTNNQNTGSVLDLASMMSFSDMINYYVNITFNPDKYLHKYIVFTSPNEQQKNTTADDSSSTHYPIIKIDNKEYYKDYYTDGSFNNDLNFVPKFLKKGAVTLTGDIIANIDDKSELYNFKIGDDNKIANIISTGYDYIPNANLSEDTGDYYPMLDLKEVFVNNQTLLNRLSIVSVGSDSKVYHAYIGHKQGELDIDYDNILTIGTNPTNANMAFNRTMTPDYEKFAEFGKLSIELPVESNKEFNLSGKQNISGDINITSNNVEIDNGDGEININTNSIKEITKEHTINSENLKITGNITLQDSDSKISITDDGITIDSGDNNKTILKNTVDIPGVLNANNVNINGILITSTDRVTSISISEETEKLLCSNDKNYNNNNFIFSIVGIDMNKVIEIHTSNNTETNNYSGKLLNIKNKTITTTNTNTRPFINDITYSDVTLNITKALNAIKNNDGKVPYAEGKIEVNANDEKLTIEIPDVTLKVSNNNLELIKEGDIYKSYSVNTALKYFLICAEIIYGWNDGNDDYSVIEHLIIRQAKEIMSSDISYNVDMLEHSSVQNTNGTN